MLVVILQPKVANNNIIEKPIIIILQPKIAGNNALEKDLVNSLIMSKLNDPIKIFTNS